MRNGTAAVRAARCSVGLPRVLAVAGTAVALAGCTSHPWVRKEHCQPGCVDPRCNDNIACSTNDGCPIGTECDHSICLPRKRIELSSTQLIEGFDSNEIELVRGDQNGFDVEAPKSAIHMNCALFVGSPFFEEKSIANLDACVARYRVFPLDGSRSASSTVSFRLDDLKPLAQIECSANPALNSGIAGHVLVESLRLGCWALTPYAVVAATQLVNLDPSELPEFGVTPLDSCDQSSSATNGSVCKLPAQIGICRAHACVASDGGAPAASQGGGSGTDAGVTCATLPDDTACALATPGRGRCYAGNCLDQSVLPPLVTASCTDADDWNNCFPSPLGIVGTCFNRLCRQRCRNASDCKTGDDCTFPNVPSYLGVCTAPTESP